MSITPAQSRAARGLLDWPQVKLAKLSNLGESTIKNFEAGRSVPTINNLAAIRVALEAAGVVFDDQRGMVCVGLAKPDKGAETIQLENLSAENDE
jgi:transcriptional regulator with XRE-family HTH domain